MRNIKTKHNFKSCIVLFLVGVSLGVLIESLRSKSVRDYYEDLEFELLDSKLRTSFYQIMGEDFCDIAIADNLAFSDRIYQEGLKIDVYERFNRLGDRLIDEKKKYARKTYRQDNKHRIQPEGV